MTLGTAFVVVTALLAAAGVWLLLPPVRAVGVLAQGHCGVAGSRPSGARRARAPSRAATGAFAAVTGVLLVLLDGTHLALGLTALGACWATWRLVGRARARGVARRHADLVVEACEALAAELRAGQPPSQALRVCADAWPALAPVAAAADLGGDVPAALRRTAAGVPGAGGLREVASAWQVSATSGATMALAVSRTAETARRRRRTEHLVAGELASAEATARLIALLPLLALATGTGLGGDPWGFLLLTTPGLVCLGLGLALAFIGLAWIQRIGDSVVES